MAAKAHGHRKAKSEIDKGGRRTVGILRRDLAKMGESFRQIARLSKEGSAKATDARARLGKVYRNVWAPACGRK